MKDIESTRLSIRMRGGSLGHHQAAAKEERFSKFQSEDFANLIWTLGAMAAERVFYGENSRGVGGDVYSATALTATMVGQWAMGPQPFTVAPRDGETEEQARQRVLDRFERIGLQIMNRTGGGPMTADPVTSALGDPSKRRVAGQILGQAYVTAHNLVRHNRHAIEHVADRLIEKKEIFGNDLLALLEAATIRIPEVDYNDETSWPGAFFASGSDHRTAGPAAPPPPMLEAAS